MKPSRTFARRFACLMLVLATAMASVSFLVDPFWIWQQKPGWVETHAGRNLNLDRRMRLAKALQVFSRPTDMVIIGSSKVTRGFDLQDGYNMGIASLRVAELEGMVAHLLRWRKVDRLIIGLDYTMFDSQTPVEEDYNREIDRPGYAFEAALATLFSRDALDAVYLAQQGKGNAWHWNGYQESAFYEPEQNRELVKRLAADAATIRQPDAATYAALERTLANMSAHGVRGVIYLSPMHLGIRYRLDAAGTMPLLAAWRARVQTIAQAYGIPFYDFTEAPVTHDAGLLLTGSNDAWSDPSHFTPKTGAWILKKISAEKKKKW